MQGIIFCQQVNAVLIHADAFPLGVLRQSAVQAAGQAELELPGVILQTVRYPVVVKRVDSSGSRGITVVEHSGQIEEAYENARNGSAPVHHRTE